MKGYIQIDVSLNNSKKRSGKNKTWSISYKAFLIIDVFAYRNDEIL